MTSLVPPYIEKLVAYVPGKPIEELERELGVRDAIKLASNESPFGPSPKAIEAIRMAAVATHRYPDGATYSLRRDLSELHQLDMEEIVLGNGSNEIIDLICRTFASPADHAVFGDPSFVCYQLGCTAANVPFTKVPLDDHLAWNVDALIAAVTPRTKVLFVANPNNPTGAYIGGSELQRLLREVPDQVVVVIDEAYVDFVDAAEYQSALSVRELRERLIVLRTFSKAHGLAALRVGYAIGPRQLIQYLHRIRAPFNVNAIGQAAARAALTDPQHVARYVALNRHERGRVTEELRHLGLRVAPSQANFVLVDFDRPGHAVYKEMLRLGVIIRPMPEPIPTWLRITIGLAHENDRLLECVDSLLGR